MDSVGLKNRASLAPEPGSRHASRRITIRWQLGIYLYSNIDYIYINIGGSKGGDSFKNFNAGGNRINIVIPGGF